MVVLSGRFQPSRSNRWQYVLEKKRTGEPGDHAPWRDQWVRLAALPVGGSVSLHPCRRMNACRCGRQGEMMTMRLHPWQRSIRLSLGGIKPKTGEQTGEQIAFEISRNEAGQGFQGFIQ